MRATIGEPQVAPDSGDAIADSNEEIDLSASPPPIDTDIEMDNVMARPADSTVSDDEAGFEAAEDIKVESHVSGTKKKEKDFLRECVVVNGTKFTLDLVSLICYGKYRQYLRGEQHGGTEHISCILSFNSMVMVFKVHVVVILTPIYHQLINHAMSSQCIVKNTYCYSLMWVH